MIEIRNLFFKYTREFFALYDINLKVEKGEKVALVGPVGSGKTTLLRLISKVERIQKGELYINNISINKINYAIDLSVGYVPSVPVFFEHKTVEENLKYILKVQKVNKIDIEKRINDTLTEFNLGDIKELTVNKLTKFQKYLLSFARLYLRKIDLLLIDEIFDLISLEEIEILTDILEKYFLNKETTMVLSTNSEKTADSLCNRKIYFESGSIIEKEKGEK